MFRKLQSLLLQIHRSKGAFKVHRWEEEEELFSVHVRFCILIWLSLVTSVEMVREVFFPQLSALHEPFILIGFISIYHFMRVKGRLLLWIGRAVYLFFPLFMLMGEENREEGAALLHQMEMSLLDRGIDFWHFNVYMEPGFQAELLFAAFLLWGILLFYEIGKKRSTLLFLLQALIFMSLVLFFGWETPWWICPVFLAQTLLMYMPSFFAWGVLVCIGACVIIPVSRIPSLQENASSESYKKWDEWRYSQKEKALPEGDMTAVWNLTRDDEIALTVESACEGPYYLKGFVGTFYDGRNKWTNSRSMTRNVEQGIYGSRYDLINLLGERGFYGNYVLMNHNKVSKMKSHKFKVVNQHASRKYLYLPYETKTKPSAWTEQASLSIGEQLVTKGLRGQDEYECNVVSSLAGKTRAVMGTEKAGGQEEENDAQTSSKKSVVRASSTIKTTGEIYKDYVDRVYLILPKSTRTLINDALEKSNAPASISLANTVSFVRNWMQRNIAYSEKAAPVPEGKEFLSWLLQEEKRGNDIYYAALGTMMFRYYGIPARYVEGYLYHPKTAGQEGAVLQSDAHAWTEIYVENLGWIPVELCEKYESLMPSYFPKEDSSGSNVLEPEKEEESQEEEKEEAEESEEEQEEASPEEQNTSIEQAKSSDSEKKEEDSKKDSFISSILSKIFHLGVFLFRTVLVLGIGVFFLAIFSGLAAYWVREGKWKKTGSTAACISQWYRHVLMCLYLLEDIRDIPFEEWDNRNDTFRKLLKKHDEEFDQMSLEECLAVCQVALYSPKSISWNQRKQIVSWFRQTRKRLKRKLNSIQKIRLIYDKNFF